MSRPLRVPVACIEVGGGSVETVVLEGLTGQAQEVLPGAQPPPGLPVLVAVPGLVEDGRVIAASNLDWYDVDPCAALGVDGSAALVLNDAEAAALGEAALRSCGALTFVGLGTGVGGAVVRDGAVVGTNLLGHGGAFGAAACPCGRTGCLETVAAGWALPDPLPHGRFDAIAGHVASAIRDEPLATPTLVVVAGGLARRHPGLVRAIAAALPDHVVEGTAAPRGVKSAAAWGLAFAYEQLQGALL